MQVTGFRAVVHYPADGSHQKVHCGHHVEESVSNNTQVGCATKGLARKIRLAVGT